MNYKAVNLCILYLLQDKAVNLAIRVLTSFKTSEIDGAVKSLDSKLLDVLMKYIYRGFEFPTEGSSASLLTWHEKVT
jgi:actin related protein 2/3 complex subunit 5